MTSHGTIIRAQSDCCGEVELTPREVHLVRLPEHDGAEHPRSFYSFKCSCGTWITKPAGADVFTLLGTGGVKPIDVTPERHDGEPLTEDDLIAFGLWLEGYDRKANA